MGPNPYQEKLASLVANQVTELVIEQPDFLVFREAWLVHPEKKNIVGEAGLNGRIIYRYSKNESETSEIL